MDTEATVQAEKTVKSMVDSHGNLVPLIYVKPYDKKRDKIARAIERIWRLEEARLKDLKERTFKLIDELQQASMAEAGLKPLGGKEGYIQFSSFDGMIVVRSDNPKKTEFDERIVIAQQLINEVVKDLSKDLTNVDLIEIINRAFQPRCSGRLDMQRIRDLRNYKVSHPKWLQAIDIINTCERTIGHRRYVHVSAKLDRNSEPERIVLDVSAI